jgi:hypothetical protein
MSVLESNAEKVAVPPNQSALAKRSEIVIGQCELKRQELEVWTANACTGICDIADSARMHTRFLTEKNKRTFLDFRPADRSAFERAFPSIEAIWIIEHCGSEGMINKAAKRWLPDGRGRFKSRSCLASPEFPPRKPHRLLSRRDRP